MNVLITDPDLQHQLIAQRQESGGDRFDEVWEGVYIMAPLANNNHQELQLGLASSLRIAMGWDSPAVICAGVNVSDRDEGWEHNYRCPDVVVYLPDNPARNCDTHWQGGPDFLVEIVSPHDRSREKLPFYASVGVREVLIVDRNPWTLELYTATGTPAELQLAANAAAESSTELRSRVLPVAFRLVAGKDRPRIEVSLITTPATRWLI